MLQWLETDMVHERSLVRSPKSPVINCIKLFLCPAHERSAGKDPQILKFGNRWISVVIFSLYPTKDPCYKLDSRSHIISLTQIFSIILETRQTDNSL